MKLSGMGPRDVRGRSLKSGIQGEKYFCTGQGGPVDRHSGKAQRMVVQKIMPKN